MCFVCSEAYPMTPSTPSPSLYTRLFFSHPNPFQLALTLTLILTLTSCLALSNHQLYYQQFNLDFVKLMNEYAFIQKVQSSGIMYSCL